MSTAEENFEEIDDVPIVDDTDTPPAFDAAEFANRYRTSGADSTALWAELSDEQVEKVQALGIVAPVAATIDTSEDAPRVLVAGDGGYAGAVWNAKAELKAGLHEIRSNELIVTPDTLALIEDHARKAESPNDEIRGRHLQLAAQIIASAQAAAKAAIPWPVGLVQSNVRTDPYGKVVHTLTDGLGRQKQKVFEPSEVPDELTTKTPKKPELTNKLTAQEFTALDSEQRTAFMETFPEDFKVLLEADSDRRERDYIKAGGVFH